MDICENSRNLSMLDHRGFAEISLTLSHLLLGAELIELCLLLPECKNGSTLILPFEIEGIILSLHISKFLADLLEPLLRAFIFLPCKSLFLNGKLKHLPVKGIKLRRLALYLHLDL